MTQAARARIWAVLGSFLAVYTVNMWSLSQGGPGLSEVLLFDGRQVAGSYRAVLVIGCLLSLLCATGLAYARAEQAAFWTARMPFVGVEDRGTPKPEAWDSQVYQAFFLTVFVLVPMGALVHLNRKVLNEGLIFTSVLSPNAAIVVRNSIPLARRFDAGRDKEESVCARDALTLSATGASADLRLVERRCDPLKDRGAPPYTPKDQTFTDLPVPGDVSACVAALSARNISRECGGPRDLSPVCEKDARLCRGVTWFRVGSPLAMLAATVIGYASALLFLLALFRPRMVVAGR